MRACVSHFCFVFLLTNFLVLILLTENVKTSTGEKCKTEPHLATLTSSSEMEDVGQLIGVGERAVFIRTPIEVKLECVSANPIQVKIDGEMPSLAEDVRFTRDVYDFFDTSTYCYQIVLKLRADFRVTGKYTCYNLHDNTSASSLFVFSNGKMGSTLLNNGTEQYTTGSPDDTGWIRIPCISSNPHLRPKLLRANQMRTAFKSVDMDDVVYDVGRGFRFNALSKHCCSQAYVCELESGPGTGTGDDVTEYSSTTVLLGNSEGLIGGNIFSRVWPNDFILGLNAEAVTDVRLNISNSLRVWCESNKPIHLETSLLPEHGKLIASFSVNPNSFYKYRATMQGTINRLGEVDVRCKSNEISREIHKWKILSVETSKYIPQPGIHIYQKEYYPFTCYSSTDKTPTISIIQCDDVVNCVTAQKFSHLILKDAQSVELKSFPFEVIPGHSSCVEERKATVTRCAQMSHKLGKKRGIVNCIEKISDKVRMYSENFVIGLNNSIIIKLSKSWEDPGKKDRGSDILQMDRFAKDVYVDEKITVRCNASFGIFSLGIQLMLEFQNGTNLTFKDFKNFNFQEKLNNFVLTFEAKVKIEDAAISRIWCFAPIWNTKTWSNVSEIVNVKEGEYPSVTNSSLNSTFGFEYGDEGRVLECEVYGDPLPEVVWYKDHDFLSANNTKVTKIEAVVGTNLIRLHLAKILVAHTGEYSCEAKNVKGRTEKHFQVTVGGGGKVGLENLPLISGLLGGSVLFVAVIVICVLIKLLRNRSNTIEHLTEMEIHEFEHGNQDLAKKFAELNENARYLPYQHDFEIPKEKLEFRNDDLLGTGAFGIVVKGFLTRHTEQFPVAIKTVRPAADITHLRNLLSEIKIMMYIGTHPNIIGLLGAMTRELREGKLHVVVEYCARGNLQSYLRECRSTFVNQLTAKGKLDFNKRASKKSTSTRPGSNLSTQSWKIDDFLPEPGTERRRSSTSPVKTCDLITWAFQIANGMEFLGLKKVIHGDLATRNLLLTQDLVVKITDFGLSSHLYDYMNYVKKQREEPVPWRWLSVEAIRDSKFAIESDVWAYGVTLWEIFTLGEVPYQGFSWGKEFVQELYDGYRLPAPQFATTEMYAEMRKCWDYDPTLRPPFSNLRDYFNVVLNYT